MLSRLLRFPLWSPDEIAIEWPIAETEPPSYLGVRERWLTTALLGIGLILFAINGSTTNLILPQIMTNLRVELDQVHWVTTAFGVARDGHRLITQSS